MNTIPVRCVRTALWSALVVFTLTGCVCAGTHGTSAPVITVTTVDSVSAWASPCWGYNAPKILRNQKGELWAVSFSGSHGGSEQARIHKRTAGGEWLRGAVFDSIYQPSTIFLDDDGRLNYVQNSQTRPIRHYRSTNSENLKDFALIASGNGIPDGRGWYVGVGICGRTMYMAYVTLSYDLYYTWKNITDPVWHPAVLVEAGVVDTALGNHAWLYPRFTFFGDRGYITVSSTVDGSRQNTYDKVYMVSFALAAPGAVTRELVYQGDVGYYSFSYDTIITPDSLIICGFSAGRHKYGPQRAHALPAGTYVASRRIGTTAWEVSRVDEADGGIALHWHPVNGLYALVTRGSWDRENVTLLKRSADGGRTWTTITENVLTGYPAIRHQFFAQALRQGSGSTLDGDTFHSLLTDQTAARPGEGLFDFDILHLSITLP